ncbi:MAG TPA: alpha/beta fold hydrolase [Anaeromyxobacteraceae bacterium]|nr:alpha/beta fold hydrolase [Anaeromyxobacteraceae bacterium]
MSPALVAITLLFLAFGLPVAVHAAARGRAGLRSRLGARRARRAPRLHHPVVLAHGLLGFDVVEVAGVEHAYFRGVPDLLAAHGCAVHSPKLAAAGSVAERAAALAACVRALPDRKVSIIAHSMGGLDARFAISRLGLADRVAALVTVGTPHLGTPLADVGTDVLGDRLGLRRALECLGLGVDAFYDLTTPALAAFNGAVPDADGVVYASVVGEARSRRRTHPLLLPGWLYLRASAGANDGCVPATSQPWGEVWGRVDADHWAQIGWSKHFDAGAFYEGLLKELRGRGF